MSILNQKLTKKEMDDLLNPHGFHTCDRGERILDNNYKIIQEYADKGQYNFTSVVGIIEFLMHEAGTKGFKDGQVAMKQQFRDLLGV